VIVNGWTLMAHPYFGAQVSALEAEVRVLKRRNAAGYLGKNPTKRLARIVELVTDVIPQDPGAEAFRLGNTLGSARRHWFRAKFYQQYRLFYRFDSSARIIVFAWVNDVSTKRAYDSQSDAYAVFARMLDSGNPPEDFERLVANAGPWVYPQP
jgi:toxin YhaV